MTSIATGMAAGSIASIVRLIRIGSITIDDYIGWGVPLAGLIFIIYGPARGGALEAVFRPSALETSQPPETDRPPLNRKLRLLIVTGASVATASAVTRFVAGDDLPAPLRAVVYGLGLVGLGMAVSAAGFSSLKGRRARAKRRSPREPH